MANRRWVYLKEWWRFCCFLWSAKTATIIQIPEPNDPNVKTIHNVRAIRIAWEEIHPEHLNTHKGVENVPRKEGRTILKEKQNQLGKKKKKNTKRQVNYSTPPLQATHRPPSPKRHQQPHAYFKSQLLNTTTADLASNRGQPRLSTG